jgi:putative transposase
MEEDKKPLDIALFKHGLIAPALQQHVPVQIEYFREVARKEYEVPHIGRRRFKAGTLKKWLKEYRRRGFEVLFPKQREDKGVSRKIDETIGKVIREYVQKKYAGLSSAALYRQMIAEGEVQPGQFNEGTLRRYIQDNRLKENVSPEPRKKFYHDHVNDLWIADTMHGPHIPCGRKKHKVFLIAAIDDHSRVITGGRFFFQENTLCLEHILKEAIRRFGLPLVIYCEQRQPLCELSPATTRLRAAGHRPGALTALRQPFTRQDRTLFQVRPAEVPAPDRSRSDKGYRSPQRPVSAMAHP